jgi:lipocalin
VDDETYSGGLWILSREPVLSRSGLNAARLALVEKGYTLSKLRDVAQVKEALLVEI